MGSVQIKGAQIVDSAIEASKLATNAVTSVKIADNAITSGKIGASAILTAALNDAAVTAQKLGSAAVETAKLADDAVTSAKIAAGAVDSSALGSLAVTTAKLADAGVSAAKLASNAVETAKINDGAVTTAKIAADAVDASKLDESDNYSFTGSVSVQTPSASGHAANKSYVDSVAAGLSVKENVKVAIDSNIDISDLPASIDGVTLGSGDRVLLFGQTAAAENGVYSYTSAGSSMSRATDMDAGADYPGAFLFCLQGNTFADQGFVCINDTAPNLGVTSISFQRFTGLGKVTASGGLEKQGDSILISNGGVSTAKLADNAVTTAKITDANVTASKLASNSVETVKIADNAITNAKMADNSVDTAELADNAVSSAKIADSAVSSAKIASAAISSAKIASGAVGTSALADSGVTSGKLADSSVTAAKLGISFKQQGFQISGGSTTTLDLSQALPSNTVNAVLVFKNGLSLRNMTALGDTPADEDEFSVSATGGSGGVARLTFGAALANADGVLVWFIH